MAVRRRPAFVLPREDSALDALTADARTRVARLWRRRAENERKTSQTFAALARLLDEQSASSPVRELAREAVSDELRHAEICEQVAQRYAAGGVTAVDDAGTESPLAAPDAPHFHGCTREQSGLLFVVQQCCLNETLAAAYLRSCLERAHGPVARDAVRALLRDEVTHSRLGWAHLASDHLDGADRALVAEALPGLLQTIVRIWLADPEGLHATAPEGHGSLPPAVLESVVWEAVEVLVLPGLAHVGVDARGGAAWLAAARLRAGTVGAGA